MKKTSVKKADSSEDLNCTWDLVSELSDQVKCNRNTVANVVRLFDDNNTVPFIARYRTDQTNCMEPEKLHEVKEKLDDLRELQSKIVSVVKKIEKQGKLSGKLKATLLDSRDISTVEDLYAPFKPGAKGTLAQRARDLGLEPHAEKFLTSTFVNLSGLIDPNKEGLSTLSEVETGVQNIIADIISNDKSAIDCVKESCQRSNVTLTSKTFKSKSVKIDAKKNNADKFAEYSDFSIALKNVKPHQVLAINRGEKLKMLKVKINIPVNVKQAFERHCEQKFIPRGAGEYSRKIIMSAVEGAYERLLLPRTISSLRNEMNKNAEKASVSVFSSNLKKLLLVPPVRGKPILGVDPGFTHGCKYSLISPTGKVEETGIAYLHVTKGGNGRAEADKINNILQTYRCETVAIGNGVACRETESFFSEHIKRGTFLPLKVVFCIVNEAGASIYSASDEAKKELPDLDVSLRGAVSIARRLQDPLAELVKIEPKNIGVGMYQHDISEARLKSALDGVVENCVSFVGADLNVCNEVLLRYIAGIGPSMAKKIVDHRAKNGPFVNRSQLLKISGLGQKTFEQCSGFLRVMPEIGKLGQASSCEGGETTVKGKRKKESQSGGKTKKLKLDVNSEPNILDSTSVHPESYALANNLVNLAGLSVQDIGREEFISTFKSFTTRSDLDNLATQLKTSTTTLNQIIEGLLQPIGHDIRDNYEKPFFKQGVVSLSDLKVGSTLTGKVMNVTHFGAFVDIGVGRDGLLHISSMPRSLLKGKTALELGDLVEVRVDSLELKRERIGLRLVQMLS